MASPGQNVRSRAMRAPADQAPQRPQKTRSPARHREWLACVCSSKRAGPAQNHRTRPRLVAHLRLQ
eukprot:11157691-Lingulodinium_polyedra.AAC.1